AGTLVGECPRGAWRVNVLRRCHPERSEGSSARCARTRSQSYLESRALCARSRSSHLATRSFSRFALDPSLIWSRARSARAPAPLTWRLDPSVASLLQDDRVPL